MKYLITAATSHEINVVKYRIDNPSIDYLIAGVGTTATSYHLTKYLQSHNFDFVIDIGIAGSFKPEINLGSVVVVEQEIFGELGVETDEGYTDFFVNGLLNPNEKPFSKGVLKCNIPDNVSLKRVKAITVNKITSVEDNINIYRKLYNPDIETMEGAAFFYVCLLEQIPFLQIRSISNMVGERDKSRWDIDGALNNLVEKLKDIINE